ncbi:fimbrillin family protein [Phocaeicola vulgatus]|uniref:Fimbrillin family protein n=1 Tax=Phocaeicola vulgatus TaxID=821 RepID=A0AAP3K2Y7_PHOVU|nr:fimbrillin family protein [Phocaeicola vulgatus]MDB0827909.1 fimbrillin family protein [Phocaeicola vulgatus]MDB0845130.1 fimbrillin family protein [Phocaeicola vulgatus]MDB0849366.1 fimbrillin family protein [Phocaeicola vulgatus]MDB0853662.1 fimbrillin family protein [Phocaeicola vulgatus]MDB0874981.1 fimbrillin family protein [Phocaeicola vulgatus]
MKVHKKNPSWMAGGMATMLLCTLLFSCNNEDFLESGNPEKACDNICFGISSDKNVQTRGYAGSDDEGYTADRFVLRSDDSADTLCVRAIVSEGINVSGFEGEQALTRGTPVGKDNFYDKFHVLAYWSKNGMSVDNQFYMDENATNNGSVWSTEQIYYWPGADHSFQFYAWAPTDIPTDYLTTPSSPQNKLLAYTVPKAAADQKDIVVATTNEIQGDNNEAVPLTFKHICTAVRFAVGSQMQPGSIKSVALKGIPNTGTYDMAAGTWSLGDATVDFSQTLNKETTGTEANGDAITSEQGTFMMLPQRLPAGATVEVVFANANNEKRTLTASIGNTEWTMGTTVTYKLSITPEYELEFSDIPTEVDAHYDIIPIKINAKDVEGDWTITSNQSWVTVKSALTSYEKDGYWLNTTGDYSDYCSSEGVAVERQQTLDKSGNGEVELYLFVSENNSTIDRTATLTLSKDGTEAATIDVVQKCPNWQGDLGWEVLEENLTLPYGFKWDRKVTLQKTLTGSRLEKYIEEWLTKQAFKVQPTDFLGWLGSLLWPTLVDYVNIARSGDVMTVVVDYSEIANVTSAMSATDGQANTWNLYSNVGGTSFEGEQNLINSGYAIVSESGSNEDTKNFAALYAVKLNAFDIHKGGSENQITYAIIPEQTDIKWYLPAINQFSDGAGLSGQYWSSTANNDNNNANAYSWNSSSQSIPRMDSHKVRAVRQKP